MMTRYFFYRAKLFLILFFITIYAYSQQGEFVLPDGITSDDYVDNRIIFKVKPGASQHIKSKGIMPDALRQAIKEIDGLKAKRRFPSHKSPAEKQDRTGFPLVDLSRIYHIDISGDKSLEEAINNLYHTGEIEYAQPQYIHGLLQHVPDDPLINEQYYLEKIQAFDAWQVSKGDTNTVIGIVDTGTDLEHPDLVNSIKYNYDDPINGEDSDNDGFVDNFYGWDLGENDYMPQYNAKQHGVVVSGIAAATPDNGTGIAGTGYHSNFLPVKIDDENGRLIMAYEGIVYAADRGASVINCSWGGRIGSSYGEDIVNYAIFNRDALVVAAAGNSDNQNPIYPASYEHVFSVAATDEDDIKAGFSSYGINIDVSAPGDNIYSTFANASYNSTGGTSMSAPIVSGAAAILRYYFPEYNALQIAEQIKVTADNIDYIDENSDYSGLLGTGRINMYRALTEIDYPSLRLIEHKHTKEEYSLYNVGDTMEIAGTFINLLAPADDIEVNISSSSKYVEIIESYFNTGNIGTKEYVNNHEEPFLIKLKEDIPVNYNIEFKLSYTDNNDYEGEQYFSVFVNIDYLLVDINKITTTLTSRGTIGYNYPDYQQGVGLLFKQEMTLIVCAGLILGSSTSNVVDNIYGAAEDSFNELFIPVSTIREVEEMNLSDFYASGTFKDDTDNTYGLDVKLEQHLYAWKNAPKDKFLILEYDIINKSEEDISSFYAGYFADWFISDIKQHRASFNEENRMGYAYSAVGGNYKGISLLSDGNVRHYAFDNEGFGGSININDGFTNFEKYTALKGGRSNAGVYDALNDVSTLISTGPYYLAPDDTIKIAFGILVGNHLEDLKASAKHAYDAYRGFEDEKNDDTVNIVPSQKTNDKYIIYPLPFSDQINVKFYAKKPKHYTIRILDTKGKKVRLLHDNRLSKGYHDLYFDTSEFNNKNSFLILQIITEDGIVNRKIIKSVHRE